MHDREARRIASLLSRGKVLGALAVLAILVLPPSLLVVPSASAHAASQIICRHTFIPSPNVGTGDNALDGVATITSTDAWAVGEFATGSAGQTLVEHWDGTSWSVVSSASPGSSSNELRGVSADASNDVWAVGTLTNTGGSSLTLVEHWDGVSWSVIPAVNFGSALTELFGVTSLAPNNVWAVGDFQNTGANQFVLPLTEHWNGASWSVVPNPAANIPGFGGNLHGVAATNSLRVWTVGEEFNNSTIDQTPQQPAYWYELQFPACGLGAQGANATGLRLGGGCLPQ